MLRKQPVGPAAVCVSVGAGILSSDSQHEICCIVSHSNQTETNKMLRNNLQWFAGINCAPASLRVYSYCHICDGSSLIVKFE